LSGGGPQRGVVKVPTQKNVGSFEKSGYSNGKGDPGKPETQAEKNNKGLVKEKHRRPVLKQTDNGNLWGGKKDRKRWRQNLPFSPGEKEPRTGTFLRRRQERMIKMECRWPRECRTHNEGIAGVKVAQLKRKQKDSGGTRFFGGNSVLSAGVLSQSF